MESWKKIGLISSSQLKRQDYLDLFCLAHKYKKLKNNNPLKPSKKIISLAFFEPSTRTKLSFEAAAKKIGFQTISFDSSDNTSLKKGESFEDTMRIIQGISDLIILRHPKNYIHQELVEQNILEIPLLNAGDGSNEHPTQMLLDLFTIYETQKRIEDLNIGIFGDLKYSRTVHSLIEGLKLFRPKLFFFSPKGFELNQDIIKKLDYNKISYTYFHEYKDVLSQLDIAYFTRLQKERFQNLISHSSTDLESLYPSLSANDFSRIQVRANFKILHPLPRCHELNSDLDCSPWSYYFEQAKNGLYMRQAILSSISGHYDI